jgi:hypothetical protein
MTTLRTSSAVLLLAFLAGCPADQDPPRDTDDPIDPNPPSEKATFADASEAELIAAVAAGVGYLPVIGWSSTIPGMIDAIASNDTCPSAVLNPDDTVTYEAPDTCVAPSGQSYDGSFTGENLPNLFSEEEPNDEPMSVSFDGWAVDGLVVDGTVWQSEAQPEGPYTTKADLTVTIDGLPAASVKTELLCELDDALSSTCTSDEAAEMAVAGLGTFTVAGPWSMDAYGAPLGQITLVGEDELGLDLDSWDPETGCIPAEVDGQRIDDICIGGLVTGPVEPPAETIVMGSVVSALNDQLEITLWTVGEVASTDAELVVAGSASELHALPYAGKNALDEDTWTSFLADGDYVSGESTALDPFSSENMEQIVVKFRAYDEAGEIIGCGFGGTVWAADPKDYFDWSDCPAGTF